MGACAFSASAEYTFIVLQSTSQYSGSDVLGASLTSAEMLAETVSETNSGDAFKEGINHCRA